MDSQFRRRMIRDPETALKEYNLTREQISAIKAIPTNALEKFAHQLMESFGKNLPEKKTRI